MTSAVPGAPCPEARPLPLTMSFRMLSPSLLTGLFLAVTTVASAKEHPFLADHQLTELEGGIRIDWTILGGSTCNGQEVERSNDGLSFSAVHRIDGPCGDPFIPRSYGWFDPAPPEFSTVFYRVKLGFDGYSSVKSLWFDQLTESDHRFFPNPATAQATLVLNLPASASVDLLVFDAQGHVVWELKNNSGPHISLVLAALPEGLYTWLAVSNEQRITGRFVKV
jgi:hypothetical protein